MSPARHEDDVPDQDDYPAGYDNDVSVPEDYDDRATPKQLRYLRTLAERTGQTFAYPRDGWQASREIDRLKAQKPSSRLEARLERRAISDAIARGQDDATLVDLDHETTGYGSSATWR
ncbi:MAG: DUF3072 domain-containing protein [Solirubrobacteraceae bacterium]